MRAFAKNDKLWNLGATSVAVGQSVYPGKDIEHIRNTLRHILVPETTQSVSRVIVLGPKWREDPWLDVDDVDKPSGWDRPVLIVIPDPLEVDGGNRIEGLGEWLAKHVSAKRNTVRFLLSAEGVKGIYIDKELIFCARCSYLTSIAWRDDLKYRALKADFDKPLRDLLKKRYDRFAVLRRWNYRNPEQCIFDVERIGAQGGDILNAVEKKLRSDLFDPEEFQELLIERAKESILVGEFLDELTEPPPPDTRDAIPYLGENAIYEEILKVVAKGKVVINIGGTWIGRLSEHTNDEDALRYVRSKAFRSGQERRQARLGLPEAMGGTTVTATIQKTPVSPPSENTSEGPIPGSGNGGLGGQGVISVQTPTGGDVVTPPVAGPVQIRRTEAPNTGINLSGCFEKWGIPSSQTLKLAKIEFSNLTVQQLKQVLQRLPSSMRASLEITFTEEEDDA